MDQEKFMSLNPYEIDRIEGYIFYEHPTRGDTAPIYMLTPSGNLVNTMFWDMGDFEAYGLELCKEVEEANG